MGTQVPPPYNPQGDPRWQQEAARQQLRAQRDAWKNYNRAQKEQWRAYQRSCTRSSFIGPLLLVAIGVVFLLIHFGKISYTGFFGWYGRWWPVLLICIGVLRLAEWMWARRNAEEGKPAMKYNLGGLAGLALFVLIMIGIGATGVSDGRASNLFHINLNGDDWTRMAGTKHEADPAPVMTAMPEGSSLNIENPRGDVFVSGLSDDEQVHVQAHQEVYVRRESEADSSLAQLNPLITHIDKNFSVKMAKVDNGSADLTVTVPASTTVTVNCNHGEVHVSQLKGGVTVIANKGDVEVKAVTGPVVAKVLNRESSLSVFNVTGPVQIEGRGDELSVGEVNGLVKVNGDFFGGGHVQHVRGNLDMSTGKMKLTVGRLDGEVNLDESDELKVEQAVGPVAVETRNRNVSITRVSGAVHVTNRNGDVTVASVGPMGPITIDNHKGGVQVSLPSKSSFTVQADTSDGSVQTDFSLQSKTNDNAGSLSGTVNGGGNPVRVQTTYGDIAVRRADLAPLPAVPPAPAIRLSEVPVVMPPMPPMTGFDGDAKEQLKAAQEQLKEAQKALAEAQKEAEKARVQGLKEAAKANAEAMREAQRAREEGLRAAREAQREAMKAQQEAMKAAQKAREDARRQSDRY